MKPVIAVLVLAWAARSATADPAFGAELHARLGSITAPFHVEGLPEVHSQFQAYAVVAEGWHAFVEGWRGGARFPVASSSIEQPAGSYVADYTIGNPELYVERELPAGSIGAHSPVIGVRLGAGLPLAGHGSSMSLVRNRVVAASDAIEGWRDPELYQPGVVPLTATGQASVERRRWRARARVKLPLLIRISDASLPEGSRTRRIGFMPAAALGATWRARSWVGIGVTGHIVVALPAPIAPVRDVGRSGAVQTSVAPSIEFQGRHLGVAVDLLVAIAGPLGGSVGLGVHVGWQR